jgi:peptidoglycan/LPS O-acetylase OafA/YrhL
MFLYDYYLKNPAPFFTNRRFYLPLILVFFCLTNLLVKLSRPLLADLAALGTVILCFDYLLNQGTANNRYLKGLADMSFTLYLNHLWVLLIWYAICSRYFDTLIIYERYPYYIGILISLIVCWFLYKLVEEKSLVLIAKVKSGWRNQSRIA